jgi:hypothetical protein
MRLKKTLKSSSELFHSQACFKPGLNWCDSPFSSKGVPKSVNYFFRDMDVLSNTINTGQSFKFCNGATS